ncbi:hypothetical protein BOTBODRAFT_39689 [Botryobasidium botryosum FD-172 SS1]|uniref:Uncharacterized protein n=1 Tax=Botryobasidium botryosum (strain FD-172 SS1) TaxID=930990 RepID=A0A067M398_BOTB1|nr:hypothetical protein BOTBODRAFT_39689 [Botryobasidium botryosum FD-172 SS1]
MSDFKRPTRFRVLIIGRANAGKTTILRAVCGVNEEPNVYDGKGRKIGSVRAAYHSIRDKMSGTSRAILTPSAMRGVHKIEYPLVFPSNPGYVFHDSRGFESGATDELELVRQFIQTRADSHNIEEQLYAIWHRIITAYYWSLTTIATPQAV